MASCRIPMIVLQTTASADHLRQIIAPSRSERSRPRSDTGQLRDSGFTGRVYSSEPVTAVFGKLRPPQRPTTNCTPSRWYSAEHTTINVYLATSSPRSGCERLFRAHLEIVRQEPSR